MTKKAAVKVKLIDSMRVVKRRNVEPPTVSPEAHIVEPTATVSSFATEVLPERNQLFASEEEALSFLLESVVDKLDDGSVEKAEMQEFLQMLVDTDPGLRSDLVREAGVRR